MTSPPDAPADWVSAAADAALAKATARHTGAKGDVRVTCASGISPSGRIHLGNLREIMTPHLVADELARRGVPVRHILSWDDYDRLRRVPAGVPARFAEHVGRPLSSVPDPCGEHESWAAHFKAPFRAALHDLGVDVAEISQTQMYAAGAYRSRIEHALAAREQIDAVLSRYRTRRTETDEAGDASGADYYPFKPYCPACGRDTTTVTSYDARTTEISYRCECGRQQPPTPVAQVAGKLVWKVDWPMRWAYETVDFEAGGVDHSSPGSSFTVGAELVREVFAGEPPTYLGYSFVGVSGQAKMSSSAGGAPTPGEALEVLEPAILRWLYARRRPSQAFTVAFDSEINRTYDEWDALARSVAAGTAAELPTLSRARAVGTAARTLPAPERVVPFRTLASVSDITGGDEAQILRILGDLTPTEPLTGLYAVQPRLSCAEHWAAAYLPEDERTRVRKAPDAGLMASLTPVERDGLRRLLDGLAANWSLEGLTTLVYGVPKEQLGLDPDVRPTPELKAAQREWFVLLYRLLVGRDTGPRLPTLLLSLGQDRVRRLLTDPASPGVSGTGSPTGSR